MPKISFHTANTTNIVKNKTRLKEFLLAFFKKSKIEIAEINYIFCNDEYLLKINQQFLNHNTYTDIITFNLAEPQNPIIGEIYISIDRVKENAQLHKSTTSEEIHRVIFHGALHLCGYKDKTKSQKAIMRTAENTLIAQFHK